MTVPNLSSGKHYDTLIPFYKTDPPIFYEKTMPLTFLKRDNLRG